MNASITPAILFALGLLLLLFKLAPKPVKDPFVKPQKRRGLQEKLQMSLRKAGIFDKTPSLVLMALGSVVAVSAFILLIVTKNIVLSVLLPLIVVPLVFQHSLNSRQKKFTDRATAELVPFLNRMVTAVKAGRPAQTAYVAAVQDSRELRQILGKSVAQIQTGVPFREALIETIPLLPLRMWSVFVRQIEAHEEGGGNLGTAIEQSVSQINNILQLQAEAKADFTSQERQSKLIAFVAVGGVAAFAFMVDRSIMEVLWTTVLGFINLILAGALIYFGYWLGRKQLSDFRKQANL